MATLGFEKTHIPGEVLLAVGWDAAHRHVVRSAIGFLEQLGAAEGYGNEGERAAEGERGEMSTTEGNPIAIGYRRDPSDPTTRVKVAEFFSKVFVSEEEAKAFACSDELGVLWWEMQQELGPCAQIGEARGGSVEDIKTITEIEWSDGKVETCSR